MLCIIFVSILLSNSKMVLSGGLPLSAASYILIDETSGRVLLAHNEHKKMPMASTTKIMTALVALENGNLKAKVVVDEDSVNTEGSSIYLKDQEEISLEDLLYGLMLRSGNDSAVAISKHIAKTEEDFVKMMNVKARTIGALNTNFENSHGLTHENHYSTAYDLALITREAFKNKTFEKISGTKSHTANRESDNYFVNKNKTLWEYEGGDGGKTGYTMNAGRCLVSSAKRNGMRLIATSLNARDWFNDNYKLFDYGFENYKHYLIYDKNQFMKKVNIINGKEELNIIVKNDLVYPLTEEERGMIKINMIINKDISAPIKNGDKIGLLETYLNGILIKTEDLIAGNNVKRISLIDRILKKQL